MAEKLLVVAAVAAVSIILAMNVAFTENGVVLGSASVQPQAGATDTSTSYEIGQILHGHFEDSYGSGRIGIWRQLLEVYPSGLFLAVDPARFPTESTSSIPAMSKPEKRSEHAWTMRTTSTSAI